MAGQIRRLTWISLCGMFRLNELRFTRDRKKKISSVLMGLLWILLAGMIAFYVAVTSYGLVIMEMGHLVPAVLALCVSLIVFTFTMIKAGPVLFDKNGYERQIALPVTVRAILISRFLSMYLTNMLLALFVMAAGMTAYGVLEKPGFSFYLYGIAGSLFLPLLPLTAASVVGAVIAGISSRWKQKNLAMILLTMLFVCVVMIGSFSMSGMDESQIMGVMQDLAVLIEEQIGRIYPPAIWLADAMVFQKAGAMLLYLGVSFGCFVLFVGILEHFYEKIVCLLGAREAKGDYRMSELSVSSVQKSMVERELRHYFSCPVYVTNTIVGYLLMAVLAVAVAFAGEDSIKQIIAVPGIAERVLPVLLGMLPAAMPMTACAISIEGKQWWMMQTLPVTQKEVIRSKVYANLAVIAPFYLVSEILLVASLRPDAAQLFGLVAVPAAQIVFAAEAGAAINRIFPVFDWDNEANVVKRSMSTFLMVFVGLSAGVVPMLVLAGFPEIPAITVYVVTTAVLAILALALDFSKK